MMSSPLMPPPQTGRMFSTGQKGPRGVWAQMLATVRDLSGSFDQFVHDPHPDVSRLGRAARERHPQQADDYFALGDLCVRLSVLGESLNEVYALKALAAYTRAGEIARSEARAARTAILDLAFWCAEIASQDKSRDTLRAALHVCERVQQLGIVTADSRYGARLAEAISRLRDRLGEGFELADGVTVDPVEQSGLAREVRLLTDEGPTLLRQSKASEALTCFDRAIRLDPQQAALWVWKAYALSDQGRFSEALKSYERSLELEPQSANVWNSKGLLLMELGQLDQALVCFDQALAHSRPIPMVQAIYWLNRGKSLFMQGRYPEALEALERSHALEPSPESTAGLTACREQLAEVS